MAIKEYRDFVLVARDVERDEAGVEQFSVEVFASPRGGGISVTKQKIPPDLRKELGRLERRKLDTDGVIGLGEKLADLLLPGEVREHFKGCLDMLKPGQGLRLRLRLDPALVDIPWEYIYLQRAGGEKDSMGFLVLDPRISLARHEAMPVPGDFDATPKKRRLLVALASPKGESPLDLDKERENLVGAFRGKWNNIELDFLENTTVEGLNEKLIHNVDIFHFGGHGTFKQTGLGVGYGSRVGEGAIMLTDKDGESAPMPADQLAVNLRGCGVQLVVLGACQTGRRDGQNVWSGVVAALMEAEIPAAVAMQYKIWDDAAIAFARSFYQVLAAGLPLDYAVSVGRVAAFNRCHSVREDPKLGVCWRDWGVPVLYLRAKQDFVLPAIVDAEQRRAVIEDLATKDQIRVYPNIPTLPPHYIPRDEDIIRLSELVLAGLESDADSGAINRVVALHGKGGSGKKVVAAAFARAPKTRRAFGDGIIWLETGQPVDLVEESKTVVKVFNNELSEGIKDLEGAKHVLGTILKGKNCLIVLCDVWDVNHVEYFRDKLGEKSRLLFTTRDVDVANKIGAQVHSVKPLSDAESLELLAKWSGEEVSALPSVAGTIATKCDNSPFALYLCGALAKSGEPWSDILEALLEVDRDFLMERFPGWEEEIDVFTLLQASLDILREVDEKEEISKKRCLHRYKHYLDLAILPGGREGTPEPVVMALWLHRKGLNKRNLRKILRRLNNRALLLLEGKQPLSRVSLQNLHQVYLISLVEDIATLHRALGKALLEWWKNRKPVGTEREEDKQKESYALNHLFSHLLQANSWDDLERLLTNVEYLNRKQERGRQYKFEKDFAELLRSQKIKTDPLIGILESLLAAIKTLETSKEKADWLDTFAYWINKAEGGVDKNRWPKLKKVAIEFDTTCGVVSRELADDFLKKGENAWGLRFAELYTWVYQRAEDYKECAKACEYAEKKCSLAGMEEAYRFLGRAEFTRLRALALTKRKRKTEARKAYETLNDIFSEVGERSWKLHAEEWQNYEKDITEGLYPASQEKPKAPALFRAKVVSNEHDCISAMYVIQFFEAKDGRVEWIHHKKFKPEDFYPEDTLFTVLIGGPKSPGISEVSGEFYKTEKEHYLRMYSGLYCEAHRLNAKMGKTYCYMLGGISKVNTLMAAYEFTKDPEVIEIIKTQKRPAEREE